MALANAYLLLSYFSFFNLSSSALLIKSYILGLSTLGAGTGSGSAFFAFLPLDFYGGGTEVDPSPLKYLSLCYLISAASSGVGTGGFSYNFMNNAVPSLSVYLVSGINCSPPKGAALF